MTNDYVVIGLGYVGLPLAREATRAGLPVIGFDIDQTVFASLNRADSHLDDVTGTDLEGMLQAGCRAATVEADIATAAVAVICVPTPLSPDGGPDLRAVEGAVGSVARQLRPGMLVILESTTYPATTDGVVRPILEKSGLAAGTDFHLAFSPERIDPGNKEFGPHNAPKVVGGHTPACTEQAAQFYRRFIETVVRTKGTREAEIAKLLENTYRHINIALVNEMAKFCHQLGIHLWDVIRAASSKPFGFQPFYPGPGVGGHCIPIDPDAIFTGRVPHDQVLDCGLIGIFVVPRKPVEVCHLATPLKPFEAFATGRTVVMSDVRALVAIAKESGAAELFTAGSADSLTTALVSLLDDDARRKMLADAGAAWVRAHRSWAANAQRYAHLYAELTGPDRDARDDGGTE